ncbi:MAG: hypothetical protein KGK08_04930 [Acidobacteriota bacterium]|nr:hypothetical protein [Acidobacteriota bacterium]
MPSPQPSLAFPDQPELTPEIPPTWCEGSDVYHTTEKCTRLQAIPRHRRVRYLNGGHAPGQRLCFNCEDIIRTKRTG